MAGSTFGKFFTLTTAGESHGRAISCIIDGCPGGIKLNEEILYKNLIKRKANSTISSTKRFEKDYPLILSGTLNGYTTGAPISVIVYNQNFNSSDYSSLETVFRPSHADFSYFNKYHIYEKNGGGRASGRETIARVIGGTVAETFLSTLNINTTSYVCSIGSIHSQDVNLDNIQQNDYNFGDISKLDELKAYLKNIASKQDSVGGSIKTVVRNLPTGIGEPVFRKLNALLANAIMSIGGVKSIEIGCGKKSSTMLGSSFNDEITYKNKVIFKTNNSGGILGGISNGDNIVITTHFKPTPSIGIKQKTISNKNENTTITIKGRHDICFVPRANIVVSSMVNLVLADLLIENLATNINNIKRLYDR